MDALAGTLKTKIKAIKFRCFYLIKFFDKSKAPRKKVNSHSQKFLYNNSFNSLTSRAYQNKSIRDMFKLSNTSRRVAGHSPFQKATDIFNDIDVSISALVGKMSKLNQRIVT